MDPPKLVDRRGNESPLMLNAKDRSDEKSSRLAALTNIMMITESIMLLE